MIPRLKPYFNFKEIMAVLKPQGNALEKFENEFAKTFEAKYAISFPYGRSAIYALLECMGIKDSEIIVPAYTCVVVPHAVVLSGNIPRFIDAKEDFNLDMEEVKKKINKRTKAIIPGNIFGYPVNTDELKKIKKDILVIQDCAHCFGATWNGKLVCNEGDVAFFSLNFSKQLSSVFGGILTTNDKKIYLKLKEYQENNFKNPGIRRFFKALFYFLSTYLVFNKFLYNFTHYFDYLEEKKGLGKITKYYNENKIDFPKDAFEKMSSLEAKIGLEQIKKYPEIAKRRKEIAQLYKDGLKGIPGLILPPAVEGATYSHYVPRIKNREKVIKNMKKMGVQLGRLIEYSIPHMRVYQKYRDGEFGNSLQFSKTTINLPIHPSLGDEEIKDIIKKFKNYKLIL